MDEKSRLPESILTHIPWESHSNPIWPASSFFLRRNIASYPFPGKLSPAQTLQILPLLEKKLLNLPELKSPLYLPADSLSAQEKEFLCEHFLCEESAHHASKGQGFVIDESSHFLASFNLTDHLTLQWIDCRESWQGAWEALNQIESSIGNDLEYAFSPQFGYLTSHPNLCGTSLSVICYLHLPALIISNKLEEVLKDHQQDSVEASGLFGLSSDFIGDFVLLKNKCTLGVTEASILKDLHATATYLTLAEKNERLFFEKEPPLDLKDRISRAYGLLLHSCQIETKEALDALSQIKLGIDLGWIQGMSDEEVNELLFSCQRAHLLQAEKISLNKKELKAARAEYLHKKLQKTTLQF